VSGQANFYPQHVDLPKENPANEAQRMAKNLTNVLLKLTENGKARNDEHIAALKRLSDIFKHKLDFDPEDHLPTQSSTTQTAPAAIRAAPRVHLWHTRANMPGILPPLNPHLQRVGRQKGRLQRVCSAPPTHVQRVGNPPAPNDKRRS
jgi:hypothetical protein